jgi:hypothetical protein
MPVRYHDITLCTGDWCERRTSCWRYVAGRRLPAGEQCSLMRPPYESAACPYHWPVRLDAPGVSGRDVTLTTIGSEKGRT